MSFSLPQETIQRARVLISWHKTMEMNKIIKHPDFFIRPDQEKQQKKNGKTNTGRMKSMGAKNPPTREPTREPNHRTATIVSITKEIQAFSNKCCCNLG
jgi:hypothetical protein